MTNTTEMEISMLKAGVKKGELATALNLSRAGLYKKMNNKSEFRISEVESIRRILKLSDEETKNIFFAR